MIGLDGGLIGFFLGWTLGFFVFGFKPRSKTKKFDPRWSTDREKMIKHLLDEHDCEIVMITTAPVSSHFGLFSSGRMQGHGKQVNYIITKMSSTEIKDSEYWFDGATMGSLKLGLFNQSMSRIEIFDSKTPKVSLAAARIEYKLDELVAENFEEISFRLKRNETIDLIGMACIKAISEERYRAPVVIDSCLYTR